LAGGASLFSASGITGTNKDVQSFMSNRSFTTGSSGQARTYNFVNGPDGLAYLTLTQGQTAAQYVEDYWAALYGYYSAQG